MAAPTFVAEYEGVWSATTNSRTASVTVAVGDVLVIGIIAEGDTGSFSTPSGGSGFTWTDQGTYATFNNTEAHLWVTTATVAQTFTLTVAHTGTATIWGFNCLRFSGSSGVGAATKAQSTGAAAVSITTTQANSLLVSFAGDWNAVDGTTRAWTSGATEVSYYSNPGVSYTIYGAYYADSGAIGAKSVGLTAPTGQKFTIIAVELKGTAGTSASVSVPPVTTTLSSKTPTVTGDASPSITPPVVIASFTARAPAASNGSSLVSTKPGVAFTANIPGVSAGGSSASISVPLVSATLAARVPTVLGDSINMITPAVIFYAQAPTVVAVRTIVSVFETHPQLVAEADTASVTLGTEFYVTSAAWLTAFRYPQAASGDSTMSARQVALYEANTGALVLGPFTMPAPVAGTWCVYTLAIPFSLTLNQRYRVGIFHPNGAYTATASYFNAGTGSITTTKGDFFVIPNYTDSYANKQGSFNYSPAIAFPDGTYNACAYYSDVVVTSTDPAAGAGAVYAPTSAINFTALTPAVSAAPTAATVSVPLVTINLTGQVPGVGVINSVTLFPPMIQAAFTARIPDAFSSTVVSGSGTLNISMTALAPTVAATSVTTIVIPVVPLATFVARVPAVTVVAVATVAVPVATVVFSSQVPSIGLLVPKSTMSLTAQVPAVVAVRTVSISVPTPTITFSPKLPSVATIRAVAISVPVASLTWTPRNPVVATTAPAYHFSRWTGSAEEALTLSGIWNGASINAVVSVTVV
jgi:hypothetical protein